MRRDRTIGWLGAGLATPRGPDPLRGRAAAAGRSGRSKPSRPTIDATSRRSRRSTVEAISAARSSRPQRAERDDQRLRSRATADGRSPRLTLLRRRGASPMRDRQRQRVTRPRSRHSGTQTRGWRRRAGSRAPATSHAATRHGDAHARCRARRDAELVDARIAGRQRLGRESRGGWAVAERQQQREPVQATSVQLAEGGPHHLGARVGRSVGRRGEVRGRHVLVMRSGAVLGSVLTRTSVGTPRAKLAKTLTIG